MSSHNDHLVLALQYEKQAIFETNVPEAEQNRMWAQRKAQIEAILASNHANHSESEAPSHHETLLARTISNVGLSGLAETGLALSFPPSRANLGRPLLDESELSSPATTINNTARLP
jgi:hypothetical protein